MTLALAGGDRIYDIGLLGYADPKDRGGYRYDATGYTGLWDNYESFSGYAASLYAGSRAVHKTTPCTPVDWRYIQRLNGGTAGLRIYDSGGTEIEAKYYGNLDVDANGNHRVDTYSIHTAEKLVTLADGLPEGVYYVHVFSLPASTSDFAEIGGGSYLSSKWVVFDGGVVAHNTAKGGIVGTDEFVDTVQQFIGGGSDPLDGTGNLVFAAQARDDDDPNFPSLPEVGYVSSTHGAESPPENVAVRVDGKEIPWSDAETGTQWTGSVIELRFDTHIGTQLNPSRYWADASYRLVFTRWGVDTYFGIRTTRTINRGMMFMNQNIAPNGTARNGTLLGTGFQRLSIDPGRDLAIESKPSGFASYLLPRHDGTVFHSAEGFAVAVSHIDPDEVWSEQDTREPATLVTERTRTAKTYAIVHYDTSIGGVGTPLPAGWTHQAHLRLRLFDDARVAQILE